MTKKTLILIPTLNEINNINKLYKKIINLNLKLDILFIDDNSHDGTLEIIKKIKKNKKNIYLFSRNRRMGLGKAHKDGINWAYKKNYKFLITMDSDFAHDPKYIPGLLKKINNSDLTVGSRHLKKNSTPNWSIFRKILTYGSKIVSKILFNHTMDSTNAFRCYNLKRINKNFLKFCKSDDYDFFFTSINILNIKKYKITEFPMVIKARVEGQSKMYLKYIIKSIFMFFRLFVYIIINKRKIIN